MHEPVTCYQDVEFIRCDDPCQQYGWREIVKFVNGLREKYYIKTRCKNRTTLNRIMNLWWDGKLKKRPNKLKLRSIKKYLAKYDSIEKSSK